MSSVFSYPSFQIVREDFEEGFDGWIADVDVPLDPNNPGHFVEWNIIRSKDVSYSGEYSLKFFMDGRQDDGTIWIKRKIDVKRNSHVKIKVSFMFYSESESFNTIASVCVYAGIRNPEVEENLFSGLLMKLKGGKTIITPRILYRLQRRVMGCNGDHCMMETYMTY